MSRTGLLIALSTWIALLGCGSAAAQLTDTQRASLAERIEAAAARIDPERFPDVQNAAAEVLRRVDSADRFFETKTDPDNRQAWLRYLDWDPLLESLRRMRQEDASPVPVAREAIELRHRLVGMAPGLELTVLRNLRTSLGALIDAVRLRDSDRSVDSIARQLESFATRIRGLDDSPSAEDSAVISTVLGVLQGAGQANPMRLEVRNAFGRPNIAVLISESLVQSAVGRPVLQTRPVRDCILGTRIIGDATMNGLVSANLLPSSSGTVRMEVMLTGHVSTKSVGYNGPVRLRTIGDADVQVTRQLQISEAGLQWSPAQTQATLRTQICSIEHPLRLVRKIARKEAARKKPQADQIALGRLRQRVGSQFVDQTQEATSIAMPDLLADVRPMLRRLSLDEPGRVWGSTDDAIVIDATVRRGDQISSAVSRPAIAVPYDAAIQIHESAIDNVFAPVLSGRTLSESRVNRLLEQAGRPRAADGDEEGGDTDDASPFEIDFARLRPVIFEARDQTVRLGIRGTRFAEGGRELERAMEITAIYVPATLPNGHAILLREGDVEVAFPGRGRLTISQTGLKRTIQRKFADVFPETLLDRPLEVPPSSRVESLRGRGFRATSIDARDGWLTVSVR